MNRKKPYFEFKGITRKEAQSTNGQSSLIAHFQDAETGEYISWSEKYARDLLQDIEETIEKLPDAGTWEKLRHRVEADLRLPATIEIAQIDPQRVAFVLDLMNGSLGRYPPVDIINEMKPANLKRFMRQQQDSHKPQGPEPA